MNIEDLGRGGSGYPNTWVREEVGLEVRGTFTLVPRGQMQAL